MQRTFRDAAMPKVALALVLSLSLGIASSAAVPDDVAPTECIAPAASVFFVTDRALRTGKSIKFTNQLNDPIDHLTFGKITGGKTAVPSEFPQLTAELRQAAAESGRVIIFVHGCCVSFKSALRNANDLNKRCSAPVVFYDWGSPVGSYSGSMLAFPRSQERFNGFVRTLVKELPDTKLCLIGISMGNQLIDNFLLQTPTNELGQPFHQIIMSQADMDETLLRSHLPRIAQHTKALYIYVDKRDPALTLSHALRVLASPSWHGERAGLTPNKLVDAPGVQVIDVSALSPWHSLPFGVVADNLADALQPESQNYRYIQVRPGLCEAQPK